MGTFTGNICGTPYSRSLLVAYRHQPSDMVTGSHQLSIYIRYFFLTQPAQICYQPFVLSELDVRTAIDMREYFEVSLHS